MRAMYNDHGLVIKLARGNILVIKSSKTSAKGVVFEKYGKYGDYKMPEITIEKADTVEME
jgi:hypothetical protein